jgi:chromosome segregation ATPase
VDQEPDRAEPESWSGRPPTNLERRIAQLERRVGNLKNENSRLQVLLSETEMRLADSRSDIDRLQCAVGPKDSKLSQSLDAVRRLDASQTELKRLLEANAQSWANATDEFLRVVGEELKAISKRMNHELSCDRLGTNFITTDLVKAICDSALLWTRVQIHCGDQLLNSNPVSTE